MAGFAVPFSFASLLKRRPLAGSSCRQQWDTALASVTVTGIRSSRGNMSPLRRDHRASSRSGHKMAPAPSADAPRTLRLIANERRENARIGHILHELFSSLELAPKYRRLFVVSDIFVPSLFALLASFALKIQTSRKLERRSAVDIVQAIDKSVGLLPFMSATSTENLSDHLLLPQKVDRDPARGVAPPPSDASVVLAVTPRRPRS